MVVQVQVCILASTCTLSVDSLIPRPPPFSEEHQKSSSAYVIILNTNRRTKMRKIWEQGQSIDISCLRFPLTPIWTASFPAFNPQSRAGLEASIQCFLNVTGIVTVGM